MHCQVIAAIMEEILTKWLVALLAPFRLTLWKNNRTVVPSSWEVSSDPTAQKEL